MRPRRSTMTMSAGLALGVSLALAPVPWVSRRPQVAHPRAMDP